ncbi:hypothetical protein JoomaDRAFT_2015 [Galbibacter orientalis DSM 19592]|uniref:Uncharacterized protein n=1 Tax=Galbibacter orientalis DSM 19592 TaxID=926559 RepID=I3C5X0_9FLAO|nr:hypothetical protein [Galbibacter orientalis]EIJ39013.1 hypothetical protein JoomaDRAFT_2015 [Galbibacter orientalis DSM 19592]
MKILDFLIKYWSQTTVLIFAFGYVLRTIFEFYIRKAEIKFTFIHKERAEIIKGIHLDIIKLSRELEFLALGHTLAEQNMGPTIEEGRNVFGKVLELNKKIKIKIEENEIYFSEKFISLFNELFTKISDNIILTSLNKNLTKDSNQKFEFNNSELFFKYYKKEFPKLKKKLVKEYRRYI